MGVDQEKALDKILYEEVSRKNLLLEALRREKVPLIPLLCCTVGWCERRLSGGGWRVPGGLKS
jgi:hypothetical protein